MTMDAADRRTSAAGTRRQTRRISSVRRLSASAFMESRRASLAGATMPLPHNPRRGEPAAVHRCCFLLLG